MKARYYCENCGAEVRAGASSCPRCGRVFSAVRCPKCGYTGKAADFRTGCPLCGYLQPTEQTPEQTPVAPRAAKPLRRSFPSARFAKMAIAALLVLVAALLALLLLRG
jgi:ssDNA-binding Zn-finger/Zn-ribbon topoisomerase 1